MIEFEHTFARAGSAQDNYLLILDLDRLMSCVQGGRVLGHTADDQIDAEIQARMGAMSMTFAGTVTVVERDEQANSVTLSVRSREVGGPGRADAEVRLSASDGGGSIRTAATITGKAASMGEGVVGAVVDALIRDFASKLGGV